ncbi:MAG: SDR family oxidoreductase [Planctomycetota bacterium]|nr:SDR family oxidoreductase [Planctomycetota bacterium]
MAASYLEKLFGLAGQTAVVIGGTGVLGGAICRGLAQAGAFVIVAGREGAEARVAEIRQLGGQADCRVVDVTSRQSIEELLASVVAARGQVDILVNCAGVNSATGYLEITDDDWSRVLQINLTATHWGCQIFGQHMSESGRGGAILNIGSVTCDKPLSRVFAYSASKAAVLNLTQNVARELAPHNIRVNAICPGFFPAEQNRKILDDTRIANIMTQTPMARFGDPEELIGAVLLLVSKSAGSYITGAAYYVDGGFTAMRF